MTVVKVVLRTGNADEAHNYLTDLLYGYSEIRGVMAVAETDPRQQWYGLPEDTGEFEYAVRFDRKTLRWEVAAAGTAGQESAK